jgi:hypothetical protein
MTITLNKALTLGKVIRERINDLKGLRTQVATRKSWLGQPERGELTEPTYDIKEMDKSILKLQKMAFELESLIKEQNNLVKVSFDYNEDDIFVGLV